MHDKTLDSSGFPERRWCQEFLRSWFMRRTQRAFQSPSWSRCSSPGLSSSSHSPNITLIIIIKLFKVWESGVIKGKILDHLKTLCKHRRTLEEAARFKLFIKLEMNKRNSNRWAVLKKFSVTFPFMLTIL